MLKESGFELLMAGSGQTPAPAANDIEDGGLLFRAEAEAVARAFTGAFAGELSLESAQGFSETLAAGYSRGFRFWLFVELKEHARFYLVELPRGSRPFSPGSSRQLEAAVRARGSLTVQAGESLKDVCARLVNMILRETYRVAPGM